MSNELIKRIFTSIILVSLLILAFLYSFILIILLIFVSIISWIEFNSLFLRIFNKNEPMSKFLRFLFKAISLIYLFFFSIMIFKTIGNIEIKKYLIFLITVCVCSDVGGLVFGKFFKGKKLTKISPKKTVSGSIGSVILSLPLIPIFYPIFNYNYDLIFLLILTIIVSTSCQLGDLFISYLKRRAKVKDTGDLLPGHGGVLDRIDGILFAVPIGLLMFLII